MGLQKTKPKILENKESPNECDRQMAMFYWGGQSYPLLLFPLGFLYYPGVSLFYHTIHREGIFLVERARQREKGEREMKLEEVFGDGGAGKETMVSLFQGHFPLPTPPIPMISFGSSLSPLQLSPPASRFIKLQNCFFFVIPFIIQISENLLDQRVIGKDEWFL